MQISVEKNERWKFDRNSILYLEIYTGDKRTTEDFTSKHFEEFKVWHNDNLKFIWWQTRKSLCVKKLKPID